MCSGSVGTILDPANIAGKREGGFNMAGAMDPGGQIIKATTGSDVGRKLADPAKMLSIYDSEENAKTASAAYEAARPRTEAERNKSLITGTRPNTLLGVGKIT